MLPLGSRPADNELFLENIGRKILLGEQPGYIGGMVRQAIKEIKKYLERSPNGQDLEICFVINLHVE